MAIEIASAPPQKSAGWSQRLQLNFSFGPTKVTTKERMLFTERLSLLLETGVSVHAALETLATQIDNPAFKGIIDKVAGEIAGGRSVADGLSRHPKVFSSTYRNLVAAGEGGGFMPEALKQLLQMDEKAEKLRATLVSAVTYPAFLAFFSIAVVVFILAVVFPKFSTLFNNIRSELPVTTVFLMILSDLLQEYWMVALGATGVGLFAFTRWLQRPEAQSLLDRLKLRLPVIRDIFVELYLINTLRVLSLSMSNGVSLMDALIACREVVPNRVFQRLIERVESLVNTGHGVAVGFQEAKFIPPMVKQMITTGEETGQLAFVMSRVVDFYERELEKRLATVSKMAEPIMLLLMGLLVGLIVSSLMLPIFKLSRTAH
jgi:type II secretory pathway component PulF